MNESNEDIIQYAVIWKRQIGLFKGPHDSTKHDIISQSGVRSIKIGEPCPFNPSKCLIEIIGHKENVTTAIHFMEQMRLQAERNPLESRIKHMEAKLKYMEAEVTKVKENIATLKSRLEEIF